MFHTNIKAEVTENLVIKNVKIKDTHFGIWLYNCSNSNLENILIEDARYYFLIGNTPVEAVGSNGTGILLDRVSNVYVKNVIGDKVATDTFRVQNNSKNVIFDNCHAKYSRRHGFPFIAVAVK